MSSSLKTPVLFLIFNRPDVTFRVFEEIRKAQPEQLFIAADGPRKGKEGEAQKCEQARSIVNKIDWRCEVKTLFRDKNLGCRDAVSSAINWFFDNVEEGIILEDDCLPDQSFFTFCEVLLEKYRGDKSIMHIGGANFQNGIKRGNDSYYFSKYSHIWGWATWRKAWKHYDIKMNNLDDLFRSNKSYFSFLVNERSYWKGIFTKTKNGEINTWDYQWLYSIWKNKGLSIIPNENLISNIGFNEDATHTKGSSSLGEMKTTGIGNELIHPTKKFINTSADKHYSNTFLPLKPNIVKSISIFLQDLPQRIINKLRKHY